MTYIVALTGGIGSGKTTISNGFKKIGIHVVDSDIIAKKILKKNFKILDAIKTKFGKKIFNSDQSINRILLRQYIFNNSNYRLWLEKLLHPKIYKETKKQIKMTKSKWCLWVVPLLIERKLEKKAHRILLVDTSVRNQMIRTIKRDKISFKEAKKIISLQATRKERIRLSDDIILNNKGTEKMEIYIYYLHLFYSYLAERYHQRIKLKK